MSLADFLRGTGGSGTTGGEEEGAKTVIETSRVIHVSTVINYFLKSRDLSLHCS